MVKILQNYGVCGPLFLAHPVVNIIFIFRRLCHLTQAHSNRKSVETCQLNAIIGVLLLWPEVPEIAFGTYWLRYSNATRLLPALGSCWCLALLCVWSAEADQEAVSDDGRRWLSRMLTPRLRRNRSRQKGPLHVHMRFGRRVTEIPEGSGKQFKQFLRFGRWNLLTTAAPVSHALYIASRHYDRVKMHAVNYTPALAKVGF